jgi:hypothetical protein
MADALKTQVLERPAVDEGNIAKLRGEWRAMTGMAGDILAKGYAISDSEGVRTHSFKKVIEANLKGDMFLGILKDRSGFERGVAESRIPGIRLLRRGAELMGNLSKREGDADWTMTVHGAKNFDEMNGLANELSQRHGVKINLVGELRVQKETYFREDTSTSPI